MTHADLIGWASSAVLIATLAHQVRKQWKAGKSDGVSVWLFVGQIAASTGFLVYSVLVHDWVFTITNAILVANALAGCAITVVHHTRGATKQAAPAR